MRPLESDIAKTTEVPASKSAFQLYDGGPAGGVRLNVFPPGMNPCNVDKFTAREQVIADGH